MDEKYKASIAKIRQEAGLPVKNVGSIVDLPTPGAVVTPPNDGVTWPSISEMPAVENPANEEFFNSVNSSYRRHREEN